jgi:hypothetical protein
VPEPIDDATIGDDELLYHRIRPEDMNVDATTGEYRPSSAAFRYIDNITSVDIASLTTPQRALEPAPTYRLAEIEVRAVRSVGCKVVRDPQPDNEAHALIYGSAPEGRMTKSQAKRIANMCRWTAV